MGPRREVDHAGTRRRRQPDKDTDEYLKKRERNNVAVKKSRDKARQKQEETSALVTRLRKENADLELKYKTLAKEMDVLRQIFLSQASLSPPVSQVKQESEQCLSPELPVQEEEMDEQEPLTAALIDHEYCS